MSDFQITQEKINALLEELRSWGPIEQRHTLHELAKKFDLDVFVVDRIARSDGMKIKSGYRAEEENNDVDPNSTTLDLDQEELQEALDKPDPNPEEWADDEGDTGIWHKNPTGEWERTDKKD